MKTFKDLNIGDNFYVIECNEGNFDIRLITCEIKDMKNLLNSNLYNIQATKYSGEVLLSDCLVNGDLSYYSEFRKQSNYLYSLNYFVTLQDAICFSKDKINSLIEKLNNIKQSYSLLEVNNFKF